MNAQRTKAWACGTCNSVYSSDKKGEAEGCCRRPKVSSDRRSLMAVQRAVTILARKALKTRSTKIYKQTLTILADSGDLAALLLNDKGETA